MRKGTVKKRVLLPDPKYRDPLVTRFVNYMMKSGKKSVAYGIFYDAIDLVGEKTKEDGLGVWRKALNNVMPMVEVKRKRVGGATFQVPVEVRSDRKMPTAIKWLVQYARVRSEKTMKERLAYEVIAASKGEGSAVKKKNDTHKMAESNKAFSHIRF